MPSNKKNNKQETKSNPDVQKFLDSVLDLEEQSTSSQAEKRQKLTQRRNAIDDREVVPIIDSEMLTKSVGVQTDVTGNMICIGLHELENLKDDIKGAVGQNTADIKGLRRSVLYDVKSVNDNIAFHFSLQNKTKSISELRSSLNLEEPFEDLESFYCFDSKKQNDKNHAAIVRELLAFKTRTKTLGEAISGFVGSVMSHDLQILFSGCGKTNKGVSKENFSATSTYKELKEYLMKQFPDAKHLRLVLRFKLKPQKTILMY